MNVKCKSYHYFYTGLLALISLSKFSILKSVPLCVSQVVDAMYDVHSGIKMNSHMEQGSTYINCFSGQFSCHIYAANPAHSHIKITFHSANISLAPPTLRLR